MALKELKSKELRVGPVMEPDGLPTNPADTLRTSPLFHRTSPTSCGCKPFERKEVVNLYRRNEPSPEDYMEPRPEDEGSVGVDKFGKDQNKYSQGPNDEFTTQGVRVYGS